MKMCLILGAFFLRTLQCIGWTILLLLLLNSRSASVESAANSSSLAFDPSTLAGKANTTFYIGNNRKSNAINNNNNNNNNNNTDTTRNTLITTKQLIPNIDPTNFTINISTNAIPAVQDPKFVRNNAIATHPNLTNYTSTTTNTTSTTNTTTIATTKGTSQKPNNAITTTTINIIPISSTNTTKQNDVITTTTTTINNNNNNDNNSNATTNNNTTNTTATTTTTTTTTSNDTTTPNNVLSLPVPITIVNLELPNYIKDNTLNILPRIQPVLEMAIEHFNQVYDGRINFTLIPGLGNCTREVGVAAARISCTHNISAFIGPACSLAAETIAYMANTWNVPVIAPIANTENIADKTAFPRLTRLNAFMQASIVNAVLHLVNLYKWYNIALFYDGLNDSDSALLHLSFTNRMKHTANLLDYELDYKKDPLSRYTRLLKNAALRARVFLILNLPATSMVRLLYCASKLGYTSNGNFAWLMALGDEHPRNNPLFNPSRYREKFGVGQDVIDMARKLDIGTQLKQALIFNIDTDRFKLPSDFKEELTERSKAFGIHYYTQDPDCGGPRFVLSGYWDAVSIYATVINETLSEGGNPYDGLAITKMMWNRTFPGMAEPIIIDENGDRDSEVSISGWNEKTGEYETFVLTKPKTGGLRFQNGLTAFPWPLSNGVPPTNEPLCGYLGLNCNNNNSHTTTVNITAGVLVSVVIVIGVVVIALIYRRSKRQGGQDLLWWLIQGQELVKTTARTTVGLSTLFSSKASLKEINNGPDVTMTSSVANVEQIALYKGQIVRVQRLDIKHIKLTNDLLHDFKQVREMSHTNLNRIYGATVEDSCVCLVMENCPKGTLQDLLGSDHVTLDAQFKFSLTMDIIDGLCYIHDSPLKWHGRLTSEVCWVDNRFSVKIADYGLSTLHGQVEHDITSQEYKNSCLWKSPEMLRTTSHPGSKESDIYSLGIVLSEIVTREGPFGQEVVYMTLDEILHKISSPIPGAPPFRPNVEVPLKLSYAQDVMALCWKEEPKYRPSVSDIRSIMKKSGSQFCANGSLIDNLMTRMEQYANNLEILVEDKTEELREEKKRSEELLYQMLPKSVADRLKLGMHIPPEDYDSVTIYFSDIVGFTTLSARSAPCEVVTLLNDLYSLFDGILGAYDVYKVETIGDAYMVVSGLPSRNGYMHASHIANVALDLLCGIKTFSIPHLPTEKIKLRIGLHSGPVCAGVVGLKMPRFCLFGDTVNTASRMESHGQELKIHVSSECKVILDRCGSFDTEERGIIDIKGKGQMKTFWLTGKSKQAQEKEHSGQDPKH